MAKLHFFYSTMNAGKSTSLLQSNHNYLENNLETLLFLPKENISFNEGKIVSRIGIDAKAIEVNLGKSVGGEYRAYEGSLVNVNPNELVG